MGAFLKWGLEKDLFLPFKEMTKRVKPGDKALVALYIDKSGPPLCYYEAVSLSEDKFSVYDRR